MARNESDTAKRCSIDTGEDGAATQRLQQREIIGSLAGIPLKSLSGRPRHRIGPRRLSKSHSPPPPKHSVAGIGGAEPGIDGVCRFRIGHALCDEFLQRLAMRGRPDCQFHLSRFRLFARQHPSVFYYDSQNTESNHFSENRH
jgi:hypothetical protein